MSDLVVIGLAGAARAGKDTIGEHLALMHGFTKLSFADALKRDVRRRLWRTLVAYLDERWEAMPACARAYMKPSFLDVEEQDAMITDLLWVHRTPFARRLLQEWGTELWREIDGDHWVTVVDRQASELRREGARRFVLTDARFLNELEWVAWGMDGYTVKVVRPDNDQGNLAAGHRSEEEWQAWDEWNHVFLNDSSPNWKPRLLSQVDAWLAKENIAK